MARVFNNNSRVYGGINVGSSPRQNTRARDYNERYNRYMRYKHGREKPNPFRVVNDAYTEKIMSEGFTDFLDKKFPLDKIFGDGSPVTKAIEGGTRTTIPIKNVDKFSGEAETLSKMGKYMKYLPYVVAAYDVFNDNPERGIGTAVGTYAGSAFGGTALGAKIGSIIPGFGTAVGALLGSIIGSKFKNKDPDKYLWADEVKKITGNNPDGWGSGGDWSQWFSQNYEGIDKGLGDHFGGRIRRKEISPTQALQEIHRSGFKRKPNMINPTKATATPVPNRPTRSPVLSGGGANQPIMAGGRPLGFNSMWGR